MDTTAENRRRIAYVIDNYEGPFGGTERHLLSLIRGVGEKSYDPILILLRKSDETNTRDMPCPIHCLDLPRIASPKAIVKGVILRRMLKRERISLAHLYFPDSIAFAPFFCRSASARVVASIRDTGFLLSRGHRALMAISSRFTDRYIANSRAAKEGLLGGGFCRAPEKVEVIHNGHDATRFVDAAPAGLRGKLGLPADAPLVGMVANFNPWKGHQNLLDAFVMVRSRIPDAHLALVGDGPLGIELRAKAEILGLGRSVHFLGMVEDAVPYVKDFTLGVLCSETEGFSNTLIEYLGCGKAVVATNVGGNPEIVRDGENGFLVGPGNVRGLADRVLQLISDEGLRARLGKQARKTVMENFGFEQMCARYIAIYEDLLKKGGVKNDSGR